MSDQVHEDNIIEFTLASNSAFSSHTSVSPLLTEGLIHSPAWLHDYSYVIIKNNKSRNSFVLSNKRELPVQFRYNNFV